MNVLVGHNDLVQPIRALRGCDVDDGDSRMTVKKS